MSCHAKTELRIRRHIAVLHQVKKLTQTAIVRRYGYGRQTVKNWMNVPYLDPDSSFQRAPGGIANAQKLPTTVIGAIKTK